MQERIVGVTLEEELASRRYTVTEALQIAFELLDILDYLHGLSPPVIHRDVKPANIMRRRDIGGLVLIDLGSVRAELVGETLGGQTVAGTFGYMAPEQFAGDATHATDLFGLGATMVHLLGRVPPWKLRDTEMGFAWHRAVRVPMPAREVLFSLLHKDPARRPASAAAASAMIRRALARMGDPIPELTLPEPDLAPRPTELLLERDGAVAPPTERPADLLPFTPPPELPAVHASSPLPARPLVARPQRKNWSLPLPVLLAILPLILVTQFAKLVTFIAHFRGDVAEAQPTEQVAEPSPREYREIVPVATELADSRRFKDGDRTVDWTGPRLAGGTKDTTEQVAEPSPREDHKIEPVATELAYSRRFKDGDRTVDWTGPRLAGGTKGTLGEVVGAFSTCGVSGTTLELTINVATDGSGSLESVRGDCAESLVKPLFEAVSTWRFNAAVKDGVPVEAPVEIRITI